MILRKDARILSDALLKRQFARLFNARVSMWSYRSGSVQRIPNCCALLLALSVIAAGMVSGCGSNLSSKAGQISITDPTGAVSGQLASLAMGAKANVAMTPVSDTANAGVDWSILCSGSPVTGSTANGACGTISPAHTNAGAIAVYTAPTSIPIDNTVTISAAPTSNPSSRSNSTLTIGYPPITVTFNKSVSTLYVGGTALLAVLVANDTSSQGVKWTATCGSPGYCGSFNPITTADDNPTTYTAPAAVPNGNTVTITATSLADTSKSASATVTILPTTAVNPVTVSISPSAFQIGVGTSETANLVATVTNDSTNGGVSWSVSCGSASCGRITSSSTPSGTVATYVAPSSIPNPNTVTITATAAATASNAQPATASATATIIAASTIAVSVSSSASTVTVNTPSTLLTAVVSPYATVTGVTWSASCGSTAVNACGTIAANAGSNGTYTATYTAPASVPSGGLVTVTATPNSTSLQSNPGIATLTIAALKPAIAWTTAPPSSMTVNATTPVNATVSNDPSAEGVKWAISCTSTVTA